jgi:predicted amidohydrolase
MELVVGLHQGEPGSGLLPGERDFYRASGIDLLVFPEYFWVRPEDQGMADSAAHGEEDLATLAELSREEGWMVCGGTFVETTPAGWRNTCPLFHRGMELVRYRKIHLMPGEEKGGVVPGEDFVLAEVGGLRIAPVICADVFHEDTFHRLEALSPEVVVAPVASPFLPRDTPEAKEGRDRDLFQRLADRAGGILIKVAGTGNLRGRPLQGRCLVVTPEGILFRTPFAEEQERRTWVVRIPLEEKP